MATEDAIKQVVEECLTQDVADSVVGKSVDEAVKMVEQAGKLCVLPGGAYTMIYKPNRIHLVVDRDTGVVVRTKVG